MAIGTFAFIFICFVIALIIGIYAWFYVFNKKDGFCDVLEERGEEGSEHLVVAKSNVPYRFLGRTPGKPDSQRVNGYKPFKPIDKTYALPWLAKRTDKMYIFRDKDGLMHPMMAEWDAKTKMLKLRPDYRETIDWIVNEFDEKDKIKEKQTGMDKFLQYAPNIAMMMMLVIGAVMWWQHEEKMQSQYTSHMNELNTKLQQASQMYDPVVLQKAMNIVAQYRIERGTENWSQYVVPNGGIVVS